MGIPHWRELATLKPSEVVVVAKEGLASALREAAMEFPDDGTPWMWRMNVTVVKVDFQSRMITAGHDVPYWPRNAILEELEDIAEFVAGSFSELFGR